MPVYRSSQNIRIPPLPAPPAHHDSSGERCHDAGRWRLGWRRRREGTSSNRGGYLRMTCSGCRPRCLFWFDSIKKTRETHAIQQLRYHTQKKLWYHTHIRSIYITSYRMMWSICTTCHTCEVLCTRSTSYLSPYLYISSTSAVCVVFTFLQYNIDITGRSTNQPMLCFFCCEVWRECFKVGWTLVVHPYCRRSFCCLLLHFIWVFVFYFKYVLCLLYSIDQYLSPFQFYWWWMTVSLLFSAWQEGVSKQPAGREERACQNKL